MRDAHYSHKVGVMGPGSNEPWEYWALGVVDPGSNGPWEKWALAAVGVMGLGSNGPCGQVLKWE